MTERPLRVIDLGNATYASALSLQESLVAQEASGGVSDHLVFVEHPPVVTLGRSASEKHLKASRERLGELGVEVFDSARGGDVTYHGPGQLVGYPIIDLKARGLKLDSYLRLLEGALVDALAKFGIESSARAGLTGVWTESGKIAAIGVAVRRWITYHGFALNVSTDMSAFDLIVPCGLAGEEVTSMEAILAAPPGMAQVKAAVAGSVADRLSAAKIEHRGAGPCIAPGGEREMTPPERVSPRLPAWLKKKIPAGPEAARVRALLKSLRLRTVCQSALCPNIVECFHEGTATFLIMGPVCTRNCAFCAVGGGEPAALEALGLKHVVITSVTRDDLADGGAAHFAAVIRSVKSISDAAVEVLVPDFGGSRESISAVLAAAPEVFNHNIETVPRLYRSVRPQADYWRSLEALAAASDIAPAVKTKSGMMAGVGETFEEMVEAFGDLRAAGVSIVTVGQYLAPSKAHLPVARFVPPEEFERLRRTALEMGFEAAQCAPLVRSSYHAGEVYLQGS